VAVLLLLAGLVGTAQVGAKAPEEEWNKTFGGRATGCAVAQTSDGGYIILGNPPWLIKTDPTGNEEWNKTFSGTDYSVNTFAQTSDGGYIIIGDRLYYGRGRSYGLSDILLIKTDSNGNEEWTKRFRLDGSNYNNGYSVAQTPDGGYIITGSAVYNFGRSDLLLIKTDSNGNEEWNKTFGGSGGNTGFSVALTSDGGYIIAGDTESYGAGEADAWLIKTDASGNERWNRTFGTKSGTEWAISAQQTSDSGYILTGHTGSYNAWLIKTDINGDKQWDKTFSKGNYSRGDLIIQTSDGGYIIAGHTYKGWGTIKHGLLLIKTDSRGNEEWVKIIEGVEALDFTKGPYVAQTFDGGYIAVATRLGGGIYLIKLGYAAAPGKKTTPEIPTGEEKGIPGFEAVFAIAGLLAVAYIFRRRK